MRMFQQAAACIVRPAGEKGGSDDVMTPDEYRRIVGRLRGRRPPCLTCRDETLLRCMSAGTECARFERFASVPPARERPVR